ncbi:calcium-dependent phosphotriesterase [Rhizophagus irregularis]|uniref:Calcium-dependent phosphotriesterase n=1 Tax=Rhizophagus irregularis TaxID=588596 RepID=A0A2N0S5X5_9GLOM|nr:calcium-dependent phosphotriesterase [Rhizophagus irregularis]
MFRSITILVLIFAIITALSYNWIYEFYTVFGYNRPHIKPYENGKCRKIEGVEACEDIHIHHRTGYAFMACGKEIERIRGYWPPIGTYNSSIQSIDTPYIYDINNDKLIPLVLKNFPPEEDFATHGLGIYEDPENENKLYLFFVNHKRSGSCFEIFEHTLHTNELIHLETIQHKLINTPNDVVPVSRHEFYFTNDHYNNNPTYKHLEHILPLSWANVVFHSSITNETKIVAEMRLPNGITSNLDNSLIYVATTFGYVLVYERNKYNNELELKDKIFTGYATDNLSVDEETGEIYCAIFPKPYMVVAAHGKELGYAPFVPTGILKISNNTERDNEKYSLKPIFEDDGSLFQLTTIAAVDRKRNTLLLGSFRSKGIVRCNSLEPLI